MNTLREIGYINKLDNPDNLKKIINRLPYSMKLKWRDTVDRIIEKEARDVTVRDITDFVTAKARAATHPIFGNVVNEYKAKQDLDKQRRRRSSKANGFSTQGKTQHPETSHEKPKCPLCSTNIGCHAVTSSESNLWKKGKSSSKIRNSAAIVSLPVTSYVHAKEIASARLKAVPRSTQPFSIRVVPNPACTSLLKTVRILR